MLDIARIRNQPDEVAEALNRRETADFAPVIGEIAAADKKWRALLGDFESLRAQQKKTNETMGKKRRAGEPVDDLMADLKSLADKTKIAEKAADEARQAIDDLMIGLPNIPDPDIPAGGKEANEVLTEKNPVPAFDFTPQEHVELCETLKLIDYTRPTKFAGRGFWIYRGMGARLEWALLNYFIQSHTADGYEFILPPHILNYQAGVGAGQFPKFQDDVFTLSERDEAGGARFLLPTSETALVNLFAGEILDEALLPLRFFAYTPCYRREAGSHGSAERGSIRGHQFNKVEMFHFAHPDHSDKSFEEIVAKAVRLVEGLGLHFRVSKLAAGDISASMCRTYDIEVLIPSLGYKEVSSVSNGRDYQPRRANIRYRPEGKGKPAFVHALNGSGLATSRLIPAIVEQFQQKDGTVIVPEVLRPFLGGVEVLTPEGVQGW